MQTTNRLSWRWIGAAFAAGLVIGIPLGMGAMIVLAQVLAAQTALP